MRGRVCFTIALLFAGFSCAAAQTKPATISEKTAGLTERMGLLPSYVDTVAGKALLKLPAPDANGLVGKFLYVESLATGLGSNDIGLDRTQLGRTYVVEIKEIADKVLLEAENLSFRSETANPDERRATREGFATSVIWAGPIAARDQDGSTLADITSLVVTDAHISAAQLGPPGSYTLDSGRSVLEPSECKAFPDNLEFQSLLTFAALKPGPAIGNHAPEARAITVHQRVSLIRLPDSNYEPRPFDPRCGGFAIGYLDFAAPLGEPLERRFICRHRLEKIDPTQPRSRVKKPIVYYVDRGVPEPVRTALIEGGRFWAKAFDAAGFIDAYRVELMPEGMDPLDIRYNVVQWMNRSTRGYAYGQAITDPRTGEILKGAVNLDSQRIRQDILLFESILGAQETGSGKPGDPIQIALKRARQLAAHEIGHTLGFRHSFAASTYGRGSVMDYPAPLLCLRKDGTIDTSKAYAESIGTWDYQAVKYAYTQFPPGADEHRELNSIVMDGLRRGLKFESDEDASESDGADSDASRWDNGRDPVADLRNTLKIRSKALAAFGERNLHSGQDVSNLELVLLPLYTLHEYGVDTVAKLIGGVHYVYAVKGDGQTPQIPVSAAVQREALDSLLGCLSPDFLEIPVPLTWKMGPNPSSVGPAPETFPRWSSYTFDSMAAAASAADHVLSDLLSPARSARIIEMHTRNASLPSLEEILTKVCDSLVKIVPSSARRTEISWTVQHVLATRLEDLASASGSSPGVRARALGALRRLANLEAALETKDPTGHAHTIAWEIRRFLSRPLSDPLREPAPPSSLPSAPIGGLG